MKNRTMWGGIVLSAAVISSIGCSGSDSAGFPATGGKADGLFPDEWAQHIADNSELKGALAPGEQRVDYTADPEFWIYEAEGSLGDAMALTATSSDGGDPILWLLDSEFKLISKNDDAYGGSADAQIFHRLDADGTYYIALADVFRRSATFTLTLAGVTIADPQDRDDFLASSVEDKMSRLYRVYTEFGSGDWEADPNAEFARTSLRIVDEMEGAAKDAVLDAYFALKTECYAKAGTSPEVSALRRGGLVYAVEMACVENNPDVEWQFMQTLDGAGEFLGSLGTVGYP